MPNITKQMKLSKVFKSENFEQIMDEYNIFGQEMDAMKFWKNHVRPIDKSILYDSWRRFSNGLTKERDEKRKKALYKIIESQVEENMLEKSTLKTILAIANMTMDEILETPEILHSVPIKDRMKWLFSALKARDSRMNVLTRAHGEKRKTDIYSDLMKDAQYGDLDESDNAPEAPEPQLIEEKSSEPNTITIPTKEKMIEFDPNNL